jgi:hypothetical protein
VEDDMTRLSAVLMHGARGGEGRYAFDVPDAVANGRSIGIAEAFMAHLDAHAGLGHIDYEINAAFTNRDLWITTVIGEMVLPHHGRQPFACFISRQD